MIRLVLLSVVCIFVEGKPLTSFYDIKMEDVDGGVIDFNALKSKPVIIANVASQCGYTASGYK